MMVFPLSATSIFFLFKAIVSCKIRYIIADWLNVLFILAQCRAVLMGHFSSRACGGFCCWLFLCVFCFVFCFCLKLSNLHHSYESPSDQVGFLSSPRALSQRALLNQWWTTSECASWRTMWLHCMNLGWFFNLLLSVFSSVKWQGQCQPHLSGCWPWCWISELTCMKNLSNWADL